MLGISWKEHRTNISILEEIGLERELTGKVARMKLQYFGHVTRGSAGNLALTVLEGSVDGLRQQGRPKRQWLDDIDCRSDVTALPSNPLADSKQTDISGVNKWCKHGAVLCYGLQSSI